MPQLRLLPILRVGNSILCDLLYVLLCPKQFFAPTSVFCSPAQISYTRGIGTFAEVMPWSLRKARTWS
jgi:hypothetical protein